MAFLIQCYAGPRVSDVLSLKPHQMEGKSLKIIQKKTKNKISIPIADGLRPWLKAYFENPQRGKFTEQKLNKHIKDIPGKQV